MSRIDPRFVLHDDHVEIGEQIGHGSFGYVHRGTFRNMAVAVKVVRADAGEHAKRQLIDEASAMQDLRPHENVVTLFGIVAEPLSLVLAFASEGSLEDVVYGGTAAKELTGDEQRRIILGVAKGLDHLHQEGVVHRDIAARNILLDHNMKALITDFGMARVLRRETSGPDPCFSEDHQTSTRVGPIRWMAIEMMVSQSYSPKSDVWAFAVLLWEVYRHEKPWPTKTNLEVAHAVMGGEHIDLSGAGVPPYLASLSTLCYATDPAERPTMNAIVAELLSRWSTAGEVLDDGQEAQASLPKLHATMQAHATKVAARAKRVPKASAPKTSSDDYSAPP
eukprot:CAMPEP_0170747056 /NCGR_PEP_ID=MMETSP0437-20130122/9124_1 /TAXON_ID=0 /ORGANISM="Sexangularia sp." /LENGTH=334 /DNA_ID=CAMNT_0011085819 /DNA_START=157 /DNA_END=1158 /DNA_ORIENTATION=+